VLATLLKLEGFHVTVAANGKRAMAVLEVAQPALIITDYDADDGWSWDGKDYASSTLLITTTSYAVNGRLSCGRKQTLANFRVRPVAVVQLTYGKQSLDGVNTTGKKC